MSEFRGSVGWTAWSPTVIASIGTFTSVSGAGRWVRMPGGTIAFSLTITITTAGTANGEILFSLPVTAQSGNLNIGSGREDTSTGAMLQARTTTGGPGTCGLIRYDNTTAIASGRTIRASGVYEAAV